MAKNIVLKDQEQIRSERKVNVVTPDLLTRIKSQYCLNWNGPHGIAHWHRVFLNGLKLATQAGVNIKVIQLFSVFHDACRQNENWDHDHGRRGAELVMELKEFCPLDDSELALLVTACELHTDAVDHEDITIQACFDSDRLDLGRVGIYPDANRLCTPLAKDMDFIAQAYFRSQEGFARGHPFDLPD